MSQERVEANRRRVVELQEKGVEVDRRKMHVDEPIKTVGEHTVDIKLHRELTAQVKVTVTAENAHEQLSGVMSRAFYKPLGAVFRLIAGIYPRLLPLRA